MQKDLETKIRVIKSIREDFKQMCGEDDKIKAVLARVDSPDAKLTDVEEYSGYIEQKLADCIVKNAGTDEVLSTLSPDLARAVLNETLGDNYDLVNEAFEKVQTALDKKININIKPQFGKFPTDRVNKVADSWTDKSVPVETIKRRMTAPVENITQSFYTENIKANAEFRSKAGLDVYIQRDGGSGCCKWCAGLTGKFSYPDNVPKDVWRRHDNCTCSISYVNHKNVQKVWSKRSWSDEEEREYLKKLDEEKKAARKAEMAGKNLHKYKRNDVGRVRFSGGTRKQNERIRARVEAVERERRIQLDKEKKPIRLTPEQAKAKETEILARRGLTNGGNSSIIELKRKENNVGTFSPLDIPMQKRNVIRICNKYSIDTKGITFKIQRNEKLMSMPFYGSTDYNNVGRIDLFPNAFSNEDELVKTILHEKCHVKQLQKYGKEYVQDHIDEVEKIAYKFESVFYNIVKKRR